MLVLRNRHCIHLGDLGNLPPQRAVYQHLYMLSNLFLYHSGKRNKVANFNIAKVQVNLCMHALLFTSKPHKEVLHHVNSLEGRLNHANATKVSTTTHNVGSLENMQTSTLHLRASSVLQQNRLVPRLPLTC